MTIKLGIIGTGGMAGAHAHHFQKIPGVKLHACMDVDPARAKAFAEKNNVTHALTRDDEVIDACDAVSIVTTDKFHVPLALKCLKAGRHTMCEKPLALSLAEARKVSRQLALLKGKPLTHLINFSHRSNLFYKALSLIQKGAIGELRYFNACYLQHWINSQEWGDWTQAAWLQWRMSTAAGSGGALGDIGCHILDYLTALTGPVASVQCTFATYPKIVNGKPTMQHAGYTLDANETAAMTLTLESGVVGLCTTTRLATGYANHVVAEVFGTEGGLRVVQGRGGMLLEGCLGKDRHKGEAGWKPIKAPPTPSNWQAFIRAIKRGGEPATPDLLRGAQVQAYLDAAERSAAKNGATMKVLSWQ